MSKVVLIDGNSILNRAYYGIPPLTNKEGLHTNAVYGFLNIMFKILAEENPTHLAVAFDLHAPTFRHKMYDAYKGTRKAADPEFIEQIPIIKEMLSAMNIPIYTLEGYEADDILGTIGKTAEKEGYKVSIISGDRDLLQLATDNIQIRIPKTIKGVTTIEDYHASTVKEVIGVTPIEYIDVKALQGDSSDNIPGVSGIGPKGAVELIQTYHDLDTLYEHIEDITKKAMKAHLIEDKDNAYLSKTLATINIEVPLNISFSDMEYEDPYTDKAYNLCKKLEFNKLLDRFDKKTVQNVSEYRLNYKTKLDKKTFDEIINGINGGTVAVSVRNIATKELTGITLSVVTDKATGGNVFAEGNKQLTLSFLTEESNEIDETDIEKYLHTIVEKADRIIVPDAKAFFKFLKDEDVALLESKDKLTDLYLLAYVLDTVRGEYTYDYVASNYLSMIVPNAKETDANTSSLIEADVLLKSVDTMYAMLSSHNMTELYKNIELPLTFVLHDMENKGIKVEREALKEYGAELDESIIELEKRIYEKCGHEFNINSPKQLGVVLFEELKLPNGKKTKTGYSTAADVLEKLAGEYPIVNDILDYRTYTKLKSTYAEGLSNFIKEDGRIHANFNQTITATGRLSSTDPNLQNIPIRMELGRKIRKAFVPREGYKFVDADYSQIELRLLAHMSGDENLIHAYENGDDIHALTASKVFKIPLCDVNDTLRRRAKAVNFGIVYGISAYGLSEDLHIPVKEATNYIESYFEAYPGIKAFLDGLVKDAKDKGYAITLFNRRRQIPEIKERNFNIRQFGERVAMNAPIQGSAADIMKIAMIKVYKRLKAENMDSKILVQVHDELLIEAKDNEVEKVYTILNEEMADAVKLAVHLPIDIHDGTNWYEAK